MIPLNFDQKVAPDSKLCHTYKIELHLPFEPKNRMSLDHAFNSEWATRIDLAACYRLCALNQWDDLIYTHISAAIPGEPDHYLINPFGMQFDEITASSLLKVNVQGELLPNQTGMVNPSGFAIHGAIHRARADAQCVMHLHNTAGIAVSAQRDGLLPLSQHAMRFMGHLGYHAYEGLALTESEGVRLVAHLGNYPAMLLRNHGTLTVGRTIAEAYVVMATLIKACEIQVGALSSSNLITPEPAIIAKAAADLHACGAEEGALEWPALLRKLDRSDTSYKH